MLLVKFDDSFRLGIKEIDDQHEYWINLTNDIYDKLLNKNYPNPLDLVDRLFEYSKAHFVLEEEFFKNYGDISLQINDHKKFVEDVKKMKELYRTNNPDYALDILSFMGHWIVNHIKTSDMKFKDLITSQNKE